MRLKIKYRESVHEIELNEEDTIEDLQAAIMSVLDVNNFEIKHKFPPRKIDISDSDKTLKFFDIRDAEVLIIKDIETSSFFSPKKSQNFNQKSTFPAELAQTHVSESSYDIFSPPEIELAHGDEKVVLRVMENDNSCLFRAVGYLIMGKMDTANELRSLVAQAIQNDPITYSDVILGRSRDEYCKWINKTNSWGGAIEISILANHFDIEICSIDVATGRADRFGEGRPMCGFIVYSGIHYDAIALTPRSGASPDFDTTIFSVEDLDVKNAIFKLTDHLRKIHYYTDTTNFLLKCKDCHMSLRGKKDALEHVKTTGHVNFDEY
ncbi:unnamed protein product [Pneumocystis jirovecii]|uniref:Ubiquitin thioesterase OTU n=2 Tax=Pneumocystis jirovecii TaxID=42068 RepID=L0P8D5_PNEJI|nr:ubiquitin-specific protease OTU1 [Pneumocystis jirovecii RU7]KTW27234.1 hypothetical protein T551_03228 [Pneumocystis jirovecii RU7]CCJ28472.1 unnamed protein product [Pneumocystis jirovecii]